MNENMMADLAWWLRWIGPAVGFLGALSLAVSTQAPFRETGVIDASGEVRAFVVLRYPWLWRAGFILLVAGFIAQTVGFFYL